MLKLSRSGTSALFRSASWTPAAYARVEWKSAICISAVDTFPLNSSGNHGPPIPAATRIPPSNLLIFPPRSGLLLPPVPTAPPLSDTKANNVFSHMPVSLRASTTPATASSIDRASASYTFLSSVASSSQVFHTAVVRVGCWYRPNGSCHSQRTQYSGLLSDTTLLLRLGLAWMGVCTAVVEYNKKSGASSLRR